MIKIFTLFLVDERANTRFNIAIFVNVSARTGLNENYHNWAAVKHIWFSISW